MKKLVLIGGGGHCKSVLDCALRTEAFDEIVITDHGVRPGTRVLGCEVVGGDDMLEALRRDGFDCAFVTVGSIRSCALRESLAAMAAKLGFAFPAIVDPSAQVSGFARVGEGTFIGKNAVVNVESDIGRHCIVNSGAIIEHECAVGDFTHVSVGAILCGNVRIGRGCFVGAGSTLIQGVGVGDNAVIGAGSTVLADVPGRATVHGVVKRVPASDAEGK